ncbi:putative serine/arginine repetitive matrix protein 1 [Iris pallida]|uniref:Serine/arginine repetitive matrix protein 1 n=1 Tax=Iris pallida TaxID=29817 RepID=A0AAX6E6W4_IRIPA|nr:putative serine/arginine repetitive matrix protein 1 [Iris pallida]
MKCKRHPSEHGAGVCAPCLHDRLLILLADQQHSRHHPSSSQSSEKDTTSPPSLRVADDDGGRSSIRRSHRRFSLFPSVFSSDDSESSSSWISSLIHCRRAKEKRVRVRTLRTRHVAGDGRSRERGRRRLRERILHRVPGRSAEEGDSGSADGRLSPSTWRRRPR